jgi:YggT family protein
VASLISIIQLAVQLLSLIVLIDVVLSFILSPFHPWRRALDSLIEPMLAPIRRIMPTVGMFDFSPVILLILIQLIGEVLIRILLSVG